MSAAEKPAYRAPALEKGLDVLELLASVSEGLTQSQIAQRLGRSLQEVYRVVVSLERRGYIRRPPGEETFWLSTKLHDLACQYPPMRRLVDAAQAIMNRTSIDTYQALHLAVLDGFMIRVIVQVDSPAPLGFRLRVGTTNPAIRTASGRLLLAFQPPEQRRWLIEALERTTPVTEFQAFTRRMEAIRRLGYEIVAGEGLKGITDVSLPILDARGIAPAVLTMPFLASAHDRVPIDTAARVLFAAAEEISAVVGGRLPAPAFPLEDPAQPKPEA